MAKKKPSPSPAAPKSPSATRTASSTRSPRPKSEPRNLAQEEIGLVAGLVWKLLDETGEQSLSSIKSTLDAPADHVIAAVGWLAREDKLSFRTSGRSVFLSLR